MFITVSSTLPWTEQLFKENTGNKSCWLRLVWTTKLYGEKKKKETWNVISQFKGVLTILQCSRNQTSLTYNSYSWPENILRLCPFITVNWEKVSVTRKIPTNWRWNWNGQAQMRSEFLIKQHFKVTKARLPGAGKSLNTMSFTLG